MAASSAVVPLGNNPVQDSCPCIAILLGAPLNAQNIERIGIPYLRLHAHVVVFDCKPLLGRSDVGLHHERASWEHVETIASVQGFEQALCRCQPTYALDFIGLCEMTPVLQAMLAASGTVFVVQKSGNLPIPSRWSRLLWKLRARRQQLTRSVAGTATTISPKAGPLSQAVRKLASVWKLRSSLRAPDVALLAGSASLNHFTRRARQILWVGSQDYHIYHHLPTTASEGLPDSPYAVFIDDNLPYASDWSLLGLSAPVTPQRYYPAMQRVFGEMEALWGMPVVIAAHPSSRHDDRIKQGFGANRLVHGRTAELVRGAQAVLLHGSTAVSFAVLAKKPMLFLSSSELSTCSYGLHVTTLAAELGHVPVDIDSHARMPTLQDLPSDPILYARYTDRYMYHCGNAEPKPWQAFIDYMKARVPV